MRFRVGGGFFFSSFRARARAFFPHAVAAAQAPDWTPSLARFPEDDARTAAESFSPEGARRARASLLPTAPSFSFTFFKTSLKTAPLFAPKP
jgi:hypothetical protein